MNCIAGVSVQFRYLVVGTLFLLTFLNFVQASPTESSVFTFYPEEYIFRKPGPPIEYSRANIRLNFEEGCRLQFCAQKLYLGKKYGAKLLAAYKRMDLSNPQEAEMRLWAETQVGEDGKIHPLALALIFDDLEAFKAFLENRPSPELFGKNASALFPLSVRWKRFKIFDHLMEISNGPRSLIEIITQAGSRTSWFEVRVMPNLDISDDFLTLWFEVLPRVGFQTIFKYYFEDLEESLGEFSAEYEDGKLAVFIPVAELGNESVFDQIHKKMRRAALAREKYWDQAVEAQMLFVQAMENYTRIIADDPGAIESRLTEDQGYAVVEFVTTKHFDAGALRNYLGLFNRRFQVQVQFADKAYKQFEPLATEGSVMWSDPSDYESDYAYLTRKMVLRIPICTWFDTKHLDEMTRQAQEQAKGYASRPKKIPAGTCAIL